MYDAVMAAFPGLRDFMINSQARCHKLGYTETILGRRRHLPDMTLEEFEFEAMPGYVNPDVDPLNPSTLANSSQIPDRVIKSLQEEFKRYKYFGQIVKRTKELADEKIKVINNRAKINDATREVVNCVDLDTEILTLNGWKKYNEVNIGDKILSYNLDKRQIELDHVKALHLSDKPTKCYQFQSPTFSAACTPNHRWVVGESSRTSRIKTAENIYKNRWPDYPIIRVADNNMNVDNPDTWSDDMLKLLGYILTDGHFDKSHYGITLYQSTARQKNIDVLNEIKRICDSLNFQYSDRCVDGTSRSIYLYKNDTLVNIQNSFPGRQLTWEFVSSLTQHQAEILMWSMIEGDGTLGHHKKNITMCCRSKCKADLFQYLAFVAGYATNCYEVTPEIHNSYPSSSKTYASISNRSAIQVTKPYYNISVLRVKRAHIYPHHKSVVTCSGVWCVTTNNGTWVARREGKVYITGNSIIQGSAADLTKMAILELVNDPRWQRLGAKLLVPVHDELCCEVPLEYREEAEEILADCMCRAATFMPFEISCDVETTFRWYGLSVNDILSFDKPQSLDVATLSESNIKWIQCRLCEMEYLCPIIKQPDGSKPRGIAAKGVNGVWDTILDTFIDDYCTKHKITRDSFIEDIDRRVLYGY